MNPPFFASRSLSGSHAPEGGGGKGRQPASRARPAAPRTPLTCSEVSPQLCASSSDPAQNGRAKHSPSSGSMVGPRRWHRDAAGRGGTRGVQRWVQRWARGCERARSRPRALLPRPRAPQAPPLHAPPGPLTTTDPAPPRTSRPRPAHPSPAPPPRLPAAPPLSHWPKRRPASPPNGRRRGSAARALTGQRPAEWRGTGQWGEAAR